MHVIRPGVRYVLSLPLLAVVLPAFAHPPALSGEYELLVQLAPDTTRYTHADLNTGQHCYFVTAYDDGGAESVASDVFCASKQSGESAELSWSASTVHTDGSALSGLAGYRVYWTVSDVARIPEPPTDLYVTAETDQTAYMLEQSDDRVVLVPVGTVPVGTKCNEAQRLRDGNGLVAYVVPHEVVKWAGSTRSVLTFARCLPG